MLALPLMVLVVTVSDGEGPLRENKSQRAARLMTADELARLADIDRQVAELRAAGNTGLLVGSSITLGVGAAYPVVMGAVAAVITVFGGFIGLVTVFAGGASILNFIGNMWVTLFGWIPIWGWIAFGAVTAIGLGLLVGALIADRPRQQRLDVLRNERKRMIDEASKRPEQPVVPPMTTVFVF